MRSTSVSVTHASSTGTFTVKSFTSSIDAGPPGCRCRRGRRGTLLPSRVRGDPAGALARPRRRSSGAGPTTAAAQAHRVAAAAVVGGDADGRRVGGGDRGATPRPGSAAGRRGPTTIGVVAGGVGRARRRARSDVAWPSAHRGLSSTASTPAGRSSSTAPITTIVSSRPAPRAASTAQRAEGPAPERRQQLVLVRRRTGEPPPAARTTAAVVIADPSGRERRRSRRDGCHARVATSCGLTSD